jgi:hypothetical protein
MEPPVRHPLGIPIDIGDPEYYADLLNMTPRDANRRLLCPDHDVPGIHGVNAPLAGRLPTLLDVVADISLCQKRNVSATMTCIKKDKDTLETQLYIAFKTEDDEAARSCPEHLQSIFGMLHQVPYQPSASDSSPKVIAKELEDQLVEICRAIHNYSYDIFEYRVNKRKLKLSEIRGYIEQGPTPFTSQQHSTLMGFLWHVDSIVKIVTNARDTKQLSYNFIKNLLSVYSYWVNHNLLLKGEFVENSYIA